MAEKVIPVEKEQRLLAAQNALEKINENAEKIVNERKNGVNIQDYETDLIACFQADFTVQEACSYVGLVPATYYRRLKEDPKFAQKMELAKQFVGFESKKRLQKIIISGDDRDAGPMLRWFLERRQPEIYRPAIPAAGVGQQNNFFLLTDEQLGQFKRASSIISNDPSQLLEDPQTLARVDTGTEEERPAQVHPAGVQSEHPQTENMPQS